MFRLRTIRLASRVSLFTRRNLTDAKYLDPEWRKLAKAETKVNPDTLFWHTPEVTITCWLVLISSGRCCKTCVFARRCGRAAVSTWITRQISLHSRPSCYHVHASPLDSMMRWLSSYWWNRFDNMQVLALRKSLMHFTRFAHADASLLMLVESCSCRPTRIKCSIWFSDTSRVLVICIAFGFTHILQIWFRSPSCGRRCWNGRCRYW